MISHPRLSKAVTSGRTPNTYEAPSCQETNCS